MGDWNWMNCDAWTSAIPSIGELRIGHQEPVERKEKDNSLYLRYNALGIPADKLVVEEEFVNKSGEMYLNCKAEYEHEFWGDKKQLDIHYKVDTDVYESWRSFTECGYLVIVLNERIRERPDFHPIAEWKEEAQ